ncbi:MAG: hypothetical protein M1458_01410 [Deltaproteobacteria bacterium]|nr:hypothetical protein [Deltaproteobacteria bacterium]
MKKIAVILTRRYSEGIRMAAGFSLLDDKVDIYLLDKDFDAAAIPLIEQYLEMIKPVAGIGLYSNFQKEGFNFISSAYLGKKFLEYDYVIPY